MFCAAAKKAAVTNAATDIAKGATHGAANAVKHAGNTPRQACQTCQTCQDLSKKNEILSAADAAAKVAKDAKDVSVKAAKHAGKTSFS